jgi:hypothetical protein
VLDYGLVHFNDTGNDLYPFGQPRPDTERGRDVQRLSDERVSERKPRERGGGGSVRAAA